MPELPEVETVCRGLAPALLGRRIAAVEQRRRDLRVPFPRGFSARLTGRRIVALRRRAKYILAELDDGAVLVVHLGMSGRLVIGATGAKSAAGAHDHVVIETEDGTAVRFHDPRRFGLMTIVNKATLDRHKLFAGLGPEPLEPEFGAGALAARLRGKRTPIKAALLDQRVVAGLGNIYVCESLFRAGLSPRRSAASVQGERAARLAPAIRAVLEEAIAAGGSSLRDYVQASGELGYFQHRFAVYDREGRPCPDCDCDIGKTGGIKRIVQSGRSTFYCARRQR